MAFKAKYTPEELEQLKDYCRSERQTEILEAVIAAGSVNRAAKLLGLHRANITRAVDRVFRTACWQGKQDGGPQEQLPPTHFLKGTSTYYNKDGEIAGRWIKTNAKQQDLLEGLREFATGLGEANIGGFEAIPVIPSKVRKSVWERPFVTMPPRRRVGSSRTTRRPSRAAARAAQIPPGVPP